MLEIEKILDAQKAWQAAAIEGDRTARNHAAEALTICADAFAVLSAHLKELGYAWVNTEQIPVGSLNRNISIIQEKIGLPVPPVLRLFWEKVGGVSCVDLKKYRHVGFWKEHHLVGPVEFCDGVHVDPCNAAWTSFVCDDFIDWQEYREENEGEKFLLSLSPDGFHKDGISGGDSYGVYPELSWNPVWRNYGWPGVKKPFTALEERPDFLSYLRTAVLECAGFPAFLGVPGFDAIREHLLRGVPLF